MVVRILAEVRERVTLVLAEVFEQRFGVCWCRKAGQRSFVTNEVTSAGAERQGSGVCAGAGRQGSGGLLPTR